jgi:cytochrome c oxidase assembly protein subunit 15
MVASGLVDRPSVAHERLATHLAVALTIMAGCLWTALDLFGRDRPSVARPRRWLWLLAPLLAVQIVYGAFTAGLRAGHLSDTWPRMYGALVPPDIYQGAVALVDDATTIYFTHRTLAWAVAAAALAAAWVCRRAGAGRRAWALGLMVLVQFGLGVATVVSGIAIPLAAAHQAGAALLLAATVWLAHWAYAPPLTHRVS